MMTKETVIKSEVEKIILQLDGEYPNLNWNMFIGNVSPKSFTNIININSASITCRGFKEESCSLVELLNEFKANHFPRFTYEVKLYNELIVKQGKNADETYLIFYNSDVPD